MRVLVSFLTERPGGVGTLQKSASPFSRLAKLSFPTAVHPGSQCGQWKHVVPMEIVYILPKNRKRTCHANMYSSSFRCNPLMFCAMQVSDAVGSTVDRPWTCADAQSGLTTHGMFTISN